MSEVCVCAFILVEEAVLPLAAAMLGGRFWFSSSCFDDEDDERSSPDPPSMQCQHLLGE